MTRAASNSAELRDNLRNLLDRGVMSSPGVASVPILTVQNEGPTELEHITHADRFEHRSRSYCAGKACPTAESDNSDSPEFSSITTSTPRNNISTCRPRAP